MCFLIMPVPVVYAAHNFSSKSLARHFGTAKVAFVKPVLVMLVPVADATPSESKQVSPFVWYAFIQRLSDTPHVIRTLE